MCWERMGVSKADGGLGFRDLEFFNKVLLAKQLWRLMKNPNSLVARIIGAKYYLLETVLGAKLRNRPSYAWRSLMAAQWALKEGLIWRVGNGRDIINKYFSTTNNHTVEKPTQSTAISKN